MFCDESYVILFLIVLFSNRKICMQKNYRTSIFQRVKQRVLCGAELIRSFTLEKKNFNLKNNLIEHAYSRKAIEFSTIFSWQMSVWLSWRTTRDSVANQFQTDSLSRCPSHAHSKCVLDLPALWKNGVSFLWTCSQKVIRVWQDGASFWLFCILVYWTMSLLIACIASVECGLEGWCGHFTAIQTFVCVTLTQLTGQIVSYL